MKTISNYSFHRPGLSILVLATTFLLAACGSDSTPSPTPETASLDETRCAYQLDPSQVVGKTVRCGYLVVPQDRREPTGPKVRVPYAVFKAIPASSKTPEIQLTGGPGQNWLNLVSQATATESSKTDRDSVIIEQRGTVATDPSLQDCTVENWGPHLHADWQAALQRSVSALKNCANSLTRQGVRLAGFNTNELAADVNDLTRLLGYRKVILNGTSYGTEWAIAVMRDFPDIVESAVLDSLIQQSDRPFESYAGGFSTALQAASDLCAANSPLCMGSEAGSLTDRFESLLGKLEAKPLIWADGPSGQFTSGVFAEGVHTFLAFYNYRDLSSFLSWLETQLAAGAENIDSLPVSADLDMNEIIKTATSSEQGQFFSIACADNATVTKQEVDNAITALRPALQNFGRAKAESYYALCQSWPARKDLPARSFQPLNSNIRTLILSGATDPLTPRSWAVNAAKTLPNATLVTFPYRGHSLQYSDCASSIKHTFYAGGTSDTRCAATDGAPTLE